MKNFRSMVAIAIAIMAIMAASCYKTAGNNNQASCQDSDEDKICDSADKCPLDFDNDVDNDGLCELEDPCPWDIGNDADSDGVCEIADKCPSDPAKIQALICGCGVADDDADSDGLMDCEDWCPYDHDNDADNDSICGDQDKCPGFADQIDVDQDSIPDGCDDCLDVDGDDYCVDVDCNDNEKTTYPGAPDVENNQVDDNCDGWVDNERSSLGGFDGYVRQTYLGYQTNGNRVINNYQIDYVFDDGIRASRYNDGTNQLIGMLVFNISGLNLSQITRIEFQAQLAEETEDSSCYGRKGSVVEKNYIRILTAYDKYSWHDNLVTSEKDNVTYFYPTAPNTSPCNFSTHCLTPGSIEGFFVDPQIKLEIENNKIKFVVDDPYGFANFRLFMLTDFNGAPYPNPDFLIIYFITDTNCSGDWTIAVDDGENTFGTGKPPVLRFIY